MPANPGIQVCYPAGEDTRGPGQLWGRDTLLSKLEEHGLRLQRVERPGSSGIVLLFAALEGPEVAALDADARGRVVLVADGQKPTPEDAEAAREAAGFLGLVLFGAFEGPEVASLDASAKSRIVLVAEGHTPKPEEAEAARQAAGLLGLVDPTSWRKSMSGLLVAWGFHGRPDVAAAAELAPLRTQGLQPVGRRAELSDVLARFLVAAESLAASGTVP